MVSKGFNVKGSESLQILGLQGPKGIKGFRAQSVPSVVYPPGMIKIKGLKGSQVLIDPRISRFPGPKGSSNSFMGRV